MPRLPNKNSQSGSNEPGALVFEGGEKAGKFVIIASLVGFLVLIGVLYGGLWWHKNQLKTKKENLDEKINKLTQESRKPIMDEALSFRDRADAARELVRDHKHWNKVFSFLESITIPEVQYSEFSADVDSAEIQFKLVTPSFKKVSQQILIYRDTEEIEEFQFEPPEKTESGVNMSVTLTISSQVWQKNN